MPEIWTVGEEFRRRPGSALSGCDDAVYDIAIIVILNVLTFQPKILKFEKKNVYSLAKYYTNNMTWTRPPN